jgi:ABC-2 type transport system permease protein/capsular polysaccharide transport system permease protein
MEPADLSVHLVPLSQDRDMEAPQPVMLSPAARINRWLFATIFVVPVLVAGLYNFVIATPRYASEMSFVVRSLESSGERFSFLNMNKSATDQGNSDAIVAYIRSRQMLGDLDRDHFLSGIFAPGAVDIFSRFPTFLSGDTREDFFRHSQRYIDVDFNRGTNITRVEVQAFRPDDARNLAVKILSASEAMLNRLNERARDHLTQAAERQVRDAGRNLGLTLGRLTDARNALRIINPDMEAGAAIRLSSATQSALTNVNVELSQTLRIAPRSPLLPQLRARRAGLEAQLRAQGNAQAGSPDALSSRFRRYDELNAEREVAEKRLLAESLSLVSARAAVDRQKLYIERVADPNLPDKALYPKGLINLGITILVCGALYWIARTLLELFIDDE